jgi:ABC-type branched-subunit amino acid transport system permease subunit
MLQRIIGFILGGLTIWILLNITDGMSGDNGPKWAFSILIGLLVALLWPWVIGIIFVRRAKDRRDEEIQAEVQRQLAEERSKSNPG